MPVREDKVQIRIDFITDESKAFANTLKDTQKLQQELKTAQKNGGDLNGIIQKIVDSGKSLANVDLNKLMPSQLITRANQLKDALKFIPAGHPDRVQMESELKRINTQLADMNGRTKGVSTSFNALKGDGLSSFGQIGGSVMKFAGWIGVAFTAVKGLWEAIKGGIDGAATLEQTSASFEVLAGGAAESKKLVKDLFDFAAKTPFETGPINEAAKKLLAYGFSADEIIPKLTKIGDVASAVGIPIDELAQIFGKAKLGNFIQAEEINQLADRGIPVFESLAKQLGVNEAQVKKLGSEGKITFKNLEKAFDDLTGAGGRFNGQMEKQSNTFNGLVSTLKDNTSQLLTTVFTPIIEGLKPILKFVIDIFVDATRSVKFFYIQAAATFEGFKAAAGQAVDNVKGFFKDLALTSFIVAKQLELALSFKNETTDRIKNEIAILERLRQESRKGGKSVGEAYTEAYYKALGDATKTEEVKKKAKKAETPFIDPEKAEKAEKDRLKRVKDALDIELKDKEIFFRRESLVNELAFLKKEKNESDYNRRELELERDKYNDILKVYDTYQGAFSAKSEQFRDIEIKKLEAQKKLLEVNAQLAPRNSVVTEGLPGIATPTSANQSETGAGLNKLAAEESLQNRMLQAKFLKQVNMEQQFELEKLALRKKYAQEALDFADAHGETEKGQIANLHKEKVKADSDYQNALMENEKRTARLKEEMEKLKLGLASEALGAAIELLSKDEAARKKNAAAIKAFQIGQITIDGIAEVAAIWRNSATYGTILGPIIGGIQTGISVVRSIAAINKVRSQKFAKGGIFGGMSHAQGGTQGMFSDGTQVEVEKDEAFIVVNKKNTPMLRQLSAVNSFGGNGVSFAGASSAAAPTFGMGGISYNTTPTFVKFDSDTSRIERALAKIDNWQSTFEVTLPITSLEKRQKEVQLDREAAQL